MSGKLELTAAQRELLQDKFTLWDRASREGAMDLRDYNRRASDALKVALAICSEDPSTPNEGAKIEAAEPFFKLAREVINPANGERPWHADSNDWMVVFSFAGQSVTLGDLRRAAALTPTEANAEGDAR